MVLELFATGRSVAEVLKAVQRILGVSEQRARQIIAIETGEIDADIELLDGSRTHP